jgi:hypothetical protein|tara:strand:- start:1128 stop:1505 length:378 start_codon:yes stop_codon:yes gene_type:complete
MNIGKELMTDGKMPAGPVCGWPKERHDRLFLLAGSEQEDEKPKKDTHVKASLRTMAKGVLKSTYQAVSQGKVSKEVREERYDICKQCPHFVEESKRCSQCGCFMEAKTWIGGDPDELCPKSKWPR